MNDDYRLMLCTCPSRETAITLARALVEEHLAACVNLLPGIRSVYRWEGRVQEDDELLLLIKTTGKRMDDLTSRLRQLHPYDVPEIIAAPISEGLDDYLSWITACTTEPKQ
ncbi:divalent-cation tolerance protein CutA [Thiorhodococcus minor]|uniref:Divalent-cation tolerance protein CutA n=1 Tax=Thiorhodococcus minor TaxID=57489 RepID=A0A6M0K2D9_9GAMM|nr:divalent-cation tolerance protein CutA [Thiorhodococcus minor]NEV63484.1 divalent-cation tolerance protein CutA [Thiorhodococcus minor]